MSRSRLNLYCRLTRSRWRSSTILLRTIHPRRFNHETHRPRSTRILRHVSLRCPRRQQYQPEPTARASAGHRGSASITGSTTPAAPQRMPLSPATMPTRTATPLTVAWALVALPVVALLALRQATPSRLSTRNRWRLSRLGWPVPLCSLYGNQQRRWR